MNIPKSNLLLICVAFALMLLTSLIINATLMYFFNVDLPDYAGYSKYNKDVLYLLFKILLAPILETLLSQKLSYELFLFITKKSQASIFLSSMLFGLMHYSSVHHMFIAFIFGLILGNCYVISLNKNNKTAFWNTCAVHSLWNLFSSCIILLFN
ncbi:CPBP family intramembrane metalloprotease [Pedobacter endophyticus]|uniref:CPBP family intramembrane metalloprotease n=2 Tax=Pedobacter endophyticus TaxID=2789740 RepID=A0A7S9L3D4_9SPHI|nr:CPBP family intramembrane metalloprotease [Pedobacter endophyticus]